MKSRQDAASLKPVHLFLGEETFLIEEKLTRAREMMGEGSSINIASYHGQDIHHMDEIIELCNTLPFFSERRLIIIRNVNKLQANEQEQILAYIRNPSDSTMLILTIEGVKEEKKFTKMLPQGIYITRCDPLKGQDLIAWIIKKAASYEKKIDKDAAFLLADTTAGNVWFMASEIEKLSLYIGERPSITMTDVEFLVMKSLEPPIFAFLDSLFDRKKDVPGKLADLESSGISELEIISRIEKLATQHYQVLVENQRNVPGINPFVEKKMAKRKSLWTARQLISMLSRMRRIEHAVKSGRTLHPYTAVHEAIMDIMSPA